LGLTKPNGRLDHELPKVQGGLSGSQHSFLHLMDPMDPRDRNAFSFSMASSNGHEPCSFSKPSSTAKIECLSHSRAKSAYVYFLSYKSLNFRVFVLRSLHSSIILRAPKLEVYNISSIHLPLV